MARKPTPKFGSGNNADKDIAMEAAQLWMRDLVKWCAQVRRDILRLEGAMHLPKGDPGPPPEEPWE